MNYFPQKSVRTAYILWLLGGFGWLGLHRIYLEKHRTCFIWTLTFGVFGVGALIDLFTLPRLVQRYNIIQQRRSLQYQLSLLTKKKERLVAEQRLAEAALCRDQEVVLQKEFKALQQQLRSTPVLALNSKAVEAFSCTAILFAAHEALS
jgi:TM2 domain-containing membrane protein YozV